VLGNTPEEGREDLYEMCAFHGQVPVKTVGPVAPGDYILPSGRDNGLGIAVSPSDLTAEQCAYVIGVSWGTLAAGVPGYVNVAVGVPVKSGVEVLQRQQETITSMETRVDALEAVLRELVPDLDVRLARHGITPSEETDAGNGIPGAAPASVDTDPIEPIPGGSEPNPDLITEEVFAQAIGIARDDLRGLGYKTQDIPLLNQLENNPSFRASYLQALKSMVRSGGNREELERLMKTVQ
jgi:hypothetical protein